MPANFYDNSGVMAGCDLHKFCTPGPPPAYIAYNMAHPHLAAAPFLWPTATMWKRTGTVKSDNWQMIQGSFDLYFVPHIPWPAPQGWLEGVELVLIHLDSSSKAQLTAHSVTGQGNALATCIAGAFGLNVNCQEGGLSAPWGVVLNLNTVETSPTAGDYMGAITGWALDAAIGWGMDTFDKSKTKDINKHIWRRIGDIPWVKVLDAPSHLQEFVQEVIDGPIRKAIEKLADEVKGTF